MMNFSSRTAVAAIASLLLIGTASAQTPAATPTTKSTPAKTAPAETKAAPEKKAEKPRTEASLECSKQADAKGLHGQERRKFRSECKKTGAKAN
ncbi:phosphate-selective porin [Nitrobacteraceae bacterium AZCC 2146]|jgi:phosphate-selective porin